MLVPVISGEFLAQVAPDSAGGVAENPLAYLGILVSPTFTWGLAFSILGLGFVIWWRFRYHYMQRAIECVRQATSEWKAQLKKGSLSSRITEVNQLMKRYPMLQRAWVQYTDHLISSSDGETVRSSRDPHEYFNDQLLQGVGINLRFYLGVPSYLVGVGLLFTFVGLVAALFIASVAMDQDPLTIKHALQDLLKAASFKFVTSIAGLGSSILFSIATKRCLMEWQEVMDEFCYELSIAAPVVSLEMLNYESLLEQQKQTDFLKKLPVALSQHIATAIDQKMRDNMKHLLEPLLGQISQVMERLTLVSQEAVARMVQDFREQLYASSQSQMELILQGLKGANESLEQMSRAIEHSGDHFGQEIRGATAEVHQKIITASSEFSTSLTPLQARIVELNQTFDQVNERLTSHLSLFTDSIDGMRDTLVEFRKAATHLENVSGPIRVATQELDAVARRIHESNQASMVALEQLARFSESLNQTAHLTRETWDVYRQRFEKVDEDLKGVVDQLGEGFRNYHHIVENFMKQLDQSLSQSTSVLSASVLELAETMEHIEARNSRLANLPPKSPTDPHRSS